MSTFPDLKVRCERQSIITSDHQVYLRLRMVRSGNLILFSELAEPGEDTGAFIVAANSTQSCG